tara:strand:+ start:89 stop:736 length:648 start_codon:yes stop_codon:yes gene_type:complete
MDIEEKVVNEDTEENNVDSNNDLIEEIQPEKIKIHPDEVFKKKIKKIPIKAVEIDESIVPEMTKVKNVKAKRTMTPEALEKLANARIKALETRRKNKQLKEAGKVKEIPLSKAKTKKQQIEKETLDKIKPIQNITNNVTNNITHEDIIRISKESAKNALVDYELVRKQRKEEKKKATQEERSRKEVVEKIQQAQGNYYQSSKQYGQPGFWRNAFL